MKEREKTNVTRAPTRTGIYENLKSRVEERACANRAAIRLADVARSRTPPHRGAFATHKRRRSGARRIASSFRGSSPLLVHVYFRPGRQQSDNIQDGT